MHACSIESALAGEEENAALLCRPATCLCCARRGRCTESTVIIQQKAKVADNKNGPGQRNAVLGLLCDADGAQCTAMLYLFAFCENGLGMQFNGIPVGLLAIVVIQESTDCLTLLGLRQP